jgi:hypothetical protein
MAGGMNVAERILQSGNVEDAAYAGLCLIASMYPERGLISGYQGFLSHWKEYLHQMSNGSELEAVFERAASSQIAHLVGMLRTIRNAIDNGGELGGEIEDALHRWLQSSYNTAGELARSEEVLPYPRPERFELAAQLGTETALRWSGSDERSYSDYHQQFRGFDFTFLGDGLGFAAYRFVINCYFDVLRLIGISPVQRYCLCYMVTRAAQEVVGEKWEDTLARVLDKQRATAGWAPTLPWGG